jgi:ribonuclease P protein subunit POP4
MNLRKRELIGLRVRVVRSTDPGVVGLEGRVVDETKNMFVLEVHGTETRVPKGGNRFRFEAGDGAELEGDEIRFRPEDRIKKAR